MAEAQFRIVAKVDPQTGAGTQKVKQDLRGIQTEARATNTAIQRSFNQAEFDRTVGSLVKNLGLLDQRLGKVAAGSEKVKQANDNVSTSNDRLQASLVRVTAAVDAEGAEQIKMNQLLVEAKRLLDANLISEERYLQVQRFATQAGTQRAASVGQQRGAYQNLGFQVQDITQSLALGISPMVVFGQQAGQTASAIGMLSNTSKGFIKFLAGPWGAIAIAATTVLIGFVAQYIELSSETEKATAKLKEDARQSEITRLAKERFKTTVEGLTIAIREQNEELKKSLDVQRSTADQATYDAGVRLHNIELRRQEIGAELEYKRAFLEAEKVRATRGGPQGEGVALRLPGLQAEIAATEAALAKIDQAIAMARDNVRRANVEQAEEAAKRRVDVAGSINSRFDKEVQDMKALGYATRMTTEMIAYQITLIEKRRVAALKEAQDAKKAETASDGVARFKSQRQAIGVAGRELQRRGLRVNEGVDFGGVTPGAHKSSHVNAVDVNVGKGVDESSVPNMKAQFDALARRYQSRGYLVLWNGWVYSPNGNGPTRRIKAGSDQHNDHMHVEAPKTIIGQSTQAGNETDAIGDERNAETVAARRADFVQGIVNRAAGQGQPSNQAAQLKSDIEEALAEFKRRFDEEASPEERGAIAKAMTDADARDTARRFEEAYLAPMRRLQALQGTVGLERDILNRKLQESERLGRQLKPEEEAQIEMSARQSDELERKAQILDQVNAPLENYKATIAALNDLLAQGAISQSTYNAKIAQMGAETRGLFANSEGVDPVSGRQYSDVAAIEEENARYAMEQEALRQNREQLYQIGISYDALVEDARRRHNENIAKIDQARKDQQMAAAQDIAGSLLSIVENSLGKQNALYKAMFAVEKAVAIARSIIAIQTGIAQASALPFPANLGAIATVVAATASIVANINAVALNFRDGGAVNGPGGPRSDSVRANLSRGEFVVNAAATARNRLLLEAINSGRTISDTRTRTVERQTAALAQRPRVSVQQHPGVAVEVQENLTTGDVEIIASRMVDKRLPKAFSSQVSQPNSEVSKALRRNTTARPKRS